MCRTRTGTPPARPAWHSCCAGACREAQASRRSPARCSAARGASRRICCDLARTAIARARSRPRLVGRWREGSTCGRLAPRWRGLGTRSSGASTRCRPRPTAASAGRRGEWAGGRRRRRASSCAARARAQNRAAARRARSGARSRAGARPGARRARRGRAEQTCTPRAAPPGHCARRERTRPRTPRRSAPRANGEWRGCTRPSVAHRSSCSSTTYELGGGELRRARGAPTAAAAAGAQAAWRP